MLKAITLKDINFKKKAEEDLPYLKKRISKYEKIVLKQGKRMEKFLRKYAKNALNNGNIEKRRKYIAKHFEASDLYHESLMNLNTYIAIYENTERDLNVQKANTDKRKGNA